MLCNIGYGLSKIAESYETVFLDTSAFAYHAGEKGVRHEPTDDAPIVASLLDAARKYGNIYVTPLILTEMRTGTINLASIAKENYSNRKGMSKFVNLHRSIDGVISKYLFQFKDGEKEYFDELMKNFDRMRTSIGAADMEIALTAKTCADMREKTALLTNDRGILTFVYMLQNGYDPLTAFSRINSSDFTNASTLQREDFFNGMVYADFMKDVKGSWYVDTADSGMDWLGD